MKAIASPPLPLAELHHGDAFPWLRGMAANDVDVCIADPPYSERQHKGVRSSRRTGLADGNGNKTGCATRRVVDLGFEHFTRADCQAICYELARIVRRWSLIFCDDNLLPIWWACARRAGLEVVRTMQWVRVGGAPQFTGDRPAVGVEHVVLLHRKGRKRWNGGGKVGVYVHPIVANRAGHRSDRIHTTQKPLPLLLDLVQDFSYSGECVLDPFMGSGTTGVAAIRLGRRFRGCELMPRPGHSEDASYFLDARERLGAELAGTDLTHTRAGQIPLFSKAG